MRVILPWAVVVAVFLGLVGVVSAAAPPARPNAEDDNEYKDILITVREAPTGSLLFGVGVNSDSGLTGSIVLNERNFDITRVPAVIDDVINGGAFRGAGQGLRLDSLPALEAQRR